MSRIDKLIAALAGKAPGGPVKSLAQERAEAAAAAIRAKAEWEAARRLKKQQRIQDVEALLEQFVDWAERNQVPLNLYAGNPKHEAWVVGRWTYEQPANYDMTVTITREVVVTRKKRRGKRYVYGMHSDGHIDTNPLTYLTVEKLAEGIARQVAASGRSWP